MVRRLPTRGLTEGALLAALVAVLAGAARYLPLVAVISPFVCPLPLALLVIRQGIRIALLASLVAALLATVLAGPLVGAVLLITFAPLGIALGLGVRQRRSAQAIVPVMPACQPGGAAAATARSMAGPGLGVPKPVCGGV